jgi:hypothetical protein
VRPWHCAVTLVLVPDLLGTLRAHVWLIAPVEIYIILAYGLGLRTNRFLGIALSINVFLILIATVFLGWHYAIDGYVSIVGTAAIWWVVGIGVRRSVPRIAEEHSAALYGGRTSMDSDMVGNLNTEAI